MIPPTAVARDDLVCQGLPRQGQLQFARALRTDPEVREVCADEPTLDPAEIIASDKSQDSSPHQCRASRGNATFRRSSHLPAVREGGIPIVRGDYHCLDCYPDWTEETKAMSTTAVYGVRVQTTFSTVTSVRYETAGELLRYFVSKDFQTCHAKGTP